MKFPKRIMKFASNIGNNSERVESVYFQYNCLTSNMFPRVNNRNLIGQCCIMEVHI